MDFTSPYFCDKEIISKPLKEAGVHRGAANMCGVPVIHLRQRFPGERLELARGAGEGGRRDGGARARPPVPSAAARESSKPAGRAAPKGLRAPGGSRNTGQPQRVCDSGQEGPGIPGSSQGPGTVARRARRHPAPPADLKGLGQPPGGPRDTQHLWQLQRVCDSGQEGPGTPSTSGSSKGSVTVARRAQGHPAPLAAPNCDMRAQGHSAPPADPKGLGQEGPGTPSTSGHSKGGPRDTQEGTGTVARGTQGHPAPPAAPKSLGRPPGGPRDTQNLQQLQRICDRRAQGHPAPLAALKGLEQEHPGTPSTSGSSKL
ncbi:collagen alpha-1(I) chain-like [Ammospiza caudacuta]|uniref:collagen alpha-1(I) chain-like n=1 Tax=Ammospiza caudacuta TaxID=2857398 RepID=UPI002739945E|nr:collagen alpha-1(I) chain-like [Ammospiza caudacuta]